METGPDYEWSKNHVYANGTTRVFGQRVLPSLPDVSYYGVNEMCEGERSEFLEWYEKQKPPFDNRRVLEQYCQKHVTVLGQACRVFRREFIQIGNLDFILESITIVSACNKVLRNRFRQADTLGLIPAGGYTCKKTAVRRR